MFNVFIRYKVFESGKDLPTLGERLKSLTPNIMTERQCSVRHSQSQLSSLLGYIFDDIIQKPALRKRIKANLSQLNISQPGTFKTYKSKRDKELQVVFQRYDFIYTYNIKTSKHHVFCTRKK